MGTLKFLLTAVWFAPSPRVGKFYSMLVHTPAHAHRGVTLGGLVVAFAVTFRHVHSYEHHNRTFKIVAIDISSYGVIRETNKILH